MESPNSTRCDQADKASLQTYAIFIAKGSMIQSAHSRNQTVSQALKSNRETIDHINSQDVEATQVSISRWADKMLWYIYTIECYSSIKKNKILPFMTVWMDPEGIMLSE